MEGITRRLTITCISLFTVTLLAQSPTSASETNGSHRGTVPIKACAVGAPFGNTSNEHFPEFASIVDVGNATIRLSAFGYPALVAPISWTCSGFRAEDGGSIFTAVPPGEAAPSITSGLALNQPGTSRIVVFGEVADQSGVWSITCALFPSQRHKFQGQCPYRVSATETDTRDGPDVVKFSDGPGITGSGQPSGGTDPSIGAVVFKNSSAAKITCVLPKNEGSVCRAAIDNFITFELSLRNVGEADARVTLLMHGN